MLTSHSVIAYFLTNWNIKKYMQSMKQAIVWIKTIAALPVLFFILSVIRQKDESQNGCFKKTKYAKFSEKQDFFIPWYAHENTHTEVFTHAKLCFLETPVLRFALLPYCRRIVNDLWEVNLKSQCLGKCVKAVN